MTTKIFALFLILIVIGLTACVSQEAPVKNFSGDDAVLADEIGGVTSIENDLDTSSLNNLDKELKDITW